jgi:hypothetical protein
MPKMTIDFSIPSEDFNKHANTLAMEKVALVLYGIIYRGRIT